MSAQTSISDVAREWFQKVWNERDEATIDRLLNPRGDVHGLNVTDSSSLVGPEDFKRFHRSILAAIPDLHLNISKVIEQGDWVAVRFVCEGTHVGHGIGVAPTQKRVSFSGMCLGRIENGQWVEGWNSVDFLSLNQQIGGEMRLA